MRVGSETMASSTESVRREASSVLQKAFISIAIEQINYRLRLVETPYRTVLLRMAVQTARVTVPPSSRRKFLVPVATAISLLLTLA